MVNALKEPWELAEYIGGVDGKRDDGGDGLSVDDTDCGDDVVVMMMTVVVIMKEGVGGGRRVGGGGRRRRGGRGREGQDQGEQGKRRGWW